MFKLPLLAMTATLALTACSEVVQTANAREANPDEFDFSLTNMDTSVDPADDFYRYAAGGWLDRVERPDDMPQLAFMTVVMKRLDKQLLGVVEDAAANADTAQKGTPLQQIGMLYNSYMDVDALNEAGVQPLQPELDRLDAIASKDELAAYLAHFALITGQWPIMEMDVFEGISNAKMSELYISEGEPSLRLGALYEMPDDAPPRQAFVDYMAGIMQAGGVGEDEAQAIAADTLAIETTLYKGKTDPVLMIDYRNWNNPRTIEQVDSQTGGFPMQAFLEPLGLADAEKVTVIHKDYPTAVGEVWDSYSLDQLKGFLKFRLLQRFAGVLSTDFEEPGRTFNAALGFPATQPPRSETVMQLIKQTFPQPLGKLYVDNFFDAETKPKGEDMIRRIQAEFRKRVEANEWLDQSTREEALRKIDGFYYEVGIPDRWVDYSSVEVSGNLVQSVINANRFWVQRSLDKAGKPVDRWVFSDPSHTAPTNVNAAYNPSANGFEVTAAMAQPPAFQGDMDAPVYFCRLGAVIGHEMTHGFDSGGRLFDHTGSLRDWFTDDDTEYFEAQAAKLVEQGDKYEPLPGQFMKGGLTVKENLADIGGISLAHDALQTYLAEHPEEDVEVDGLSPTQRCFIAWAQLWAEQANEPTVKLQLEDNHAPGPYRTYAPLQHLDVFYDAFDIEAGDPMWLPPEKRVDIW